MESTVADVRTQRAFARAVSTSLRREGIDINHVITKFLLADGQRVFSGPFPLGGVDGTSSGFAFVTCVVGQHRDSQFRSRLAATIVAALDPAVPPDRIFIRFDLTDPALHLIGTDVKETTNVS
ncbi:hypothetical protein [Micromonospora sp. DT233]|uniref:hypothetical protein n=1 Tax=Micromonospora sp. DT233 TaxID=3393432 RepID=UPI003CEE6C7C